MTTASAAPTRYEAESSPAVCTGTIDSNWAGFSGSGFCNGTNAVGASVQFSVNASVAGMASVGVRYANGGTTSRPADVMVNGVVVQPGVGFDPTGAWDAWAVKTFTVAVNAGGNTIRLSPTTADGLANVDYADVDVAAVARYEAEVAPATCDGTIDSNYPGYSGSGFCNGANAVGSAVQFTVNASVAGSASVSVRYANGTTVNRPADVLVNGVTRLSGSAFDPTGSWSTWATKTVAVPVDAGSNTIRLSPTTSNGLANVDYLDVTTGATPSPSPCAPPSASPTAGQPKVTVWLAGDSTMADPSGGVCPVGWGNQFAQYFTANATVRNSAVGGRSIQTWLYDPNVTSTMDSSGECVISPVTYSSRWQAMLDATNGMKAGDYLLIQFGINDSSSTCPRHVGSARYQQLLGVMAAAAKARGAHPIFLTPVAAITCSGSTAVGNRGFVTETNNAASANGAPVIDLHRLSYTLYNTLGFCPNNGDYTSGPLGAFFCNDHTHFEAAGARQIAGVVARALRDQQIPLAAYLK
ncbi:carbohydrate-binding protein [Hamadaea sp. NPDC050747]|uniref:carbohydrate-binding protein n=1 Tax=Hamadaea sp. NPDC050747 TaxID=3155789 RepID=UPI0033C691A6